MLFRQNRVSGETTPLMQHMPTTSSRIFWAKSSILLLLIKLLGKALIWQMTYFSTEDYNSDPNNTKICTAVPFKPKGNMYTGGTSMFVAAVAFLLPALGGILSDKYSACVKVLIYGAIIQFWVSVLFPLLIQLSIICHNHIWHYILFGCLTISTGLVNPLIIYGLMQNINGSGQCRKLLMFSYRIASASAQILGTIPSFLRYAVRHSITSQSFEFVGVPFSVLVIIFMYLLSCDSTACEKLKNDCFRFPTMRRLRKYYIIVTAFVPIASVTFLGVNSFYWRELKYYTKDYDGFISTAIVAGGFHLGTFVICVCGIVLVLREMFPKRLTIGTRIRFGLLLMISGKLVLFVFSFYPIAMSQLGQSHPIAVQSIYFAAAFIDGAANALTGVAMYELVDCIAERSAKAMYIGIFYTTWGMGLIVSGIVVLLLRLLPSEVSQLRPDSEDPVIQPQFYIRYSIVIFLLLLSYGYYAKVSLPLAEPLVLINLEQHDEQDEHEQELPTIVDQSLIPE